MRHHIKIHIQNNLAYLTKLDLSQEILTIADYQWLAKIINSSCLETILLPNIPSEYTEEIVSILHAATNKNTTLKNLNIDYYQSAGRINQKVLTQVKEIALRLERNRNKIFAVHGGGNIGLGLMANIISQSPHDYKVIATSNNQFATSLVNHANKLWIQHESLFSDLTSIENVTIISRNTSDVVNLYCQAALAALCVTPAVMPEVAIDIAKALLARYEMDGSGLKILVLMNLPNCAEFVRDKVTQALQAIVNDIEQVEKILAVNEFVPTVIDRIVTPISESEIKTQLENQLQNECDDKLTVFFADIPDLRSLAKNEAIKLILQNPTFLLKALTFFNLQFALFNAEKNFSMHVVDSFLEAKFFPSIKTINNLSVLEAIKNKYINGPHAVLAWIGALLGCTTIAEAIQQPEIFTFIKEMIENEIKPILCQEYPDITVTELDELESAFFNRCRVSHNDPVTRVGRDPMRKLNHGERLRDTLELAKKHNLDISTTRLEQGIAAGFIYAVSGIDPSNPGCQKLTEIYRKSNQSFSALLSYDGPAPSGNFSGLNPHKDRKVIKNIVANMHNLQELYETNKSNGKLSSTALILAAKQPSSSPLIKTSASSPKHSYHLSSRQTKTIKSFNETKDQSSTVNTLSWTSIYKSKHVAKTNEASLSPQLKKAN